MHMSNSKGKKNKPSQAKTNQKQINTQFYISVLLPCGYYHDIMAYTGFIFSISF